MSSAQHSVGTAVRLLDLSLSHHGAEGAIESFDKSEQTYVVRLDGGGALRARAEHLEPSTNTEHVRHRMATESEAAARIQSIRKGQIARADRKKATQAATRIQALRRGSLTRKATFAGASVTASQPAEEEFVPEQEEEGPSTQGDHLMAAKFRRQTHPTASPPPQARAHESGAAPGCRWAPQVPQLPHT